MKKCRASIIETSGEMNLPRSLGVFFNQNPWLGRCDIQGNNI